jgi:hypothetical protein
VGSVFLLLWSAFFDLCLQNHIKVFLHWPLLIFFVISELQPLYTKSLGIASLFNALELVSPASWVGGTTCRQACNSEMLPHSYSVHGSGWQRAWDGCTHGEKLQGRAVWAPILGMTITNQDWEEVSSWRRQRFERSISGNRKQSQLWACGIILKATLSKN